MAKKLRMPKIKLVNVHGNFCAYGPPTTGWEIVTVQPGDNALKFDNNVPVVERLRYVNPLAANGWFMHTKEIVALFDMWRMFLRPGDTILLDSYKDRGSPKVPPSASIETVLKHCTPDVASGWSVVRTQEKK